MADEAKGGLSGPAQAAVIAGAFGLLTAVLTNWDKMPWNRPASHAVQPPVATTAPATTAAPGQVPTDAAVAVADAQQRALSGQAEVLNQIAGQIEGVSAGLPPAPDKVAATPVSGTVGMPDTDADPAPPPPARTPDLFSGRWASADDDNVRIQLTGAADPGGNRYGTMIDGDGARVTVAVSGREIDFTMNAMGVPVPCVGELSSSGQAIHLTCTAMGEEQSLRLTRRP